jgi:DMSO/TMAO reductase YedYZ molybdopterin-dependent catalytic subunit
MNPDADRPRLPANQQLIRSDRWPVVGERAPRVDESPWTVAVCGAVRERRVYTLAELRGMGLVHRAVDIHCVTRWSRFDVVFGGIAIEQLLEPDNVLPGARFVSFVARSSRNHSTSLPLDVVFASRALVALEADGRPLAEEHGGPVRMVVPGKYFYKSVKWLERIECLENDRLGYWEADAGYHNGADPWREERYMAPRISKQQAARLIQQSDFRDHDLRSLDATRRDLRNLQAQRAKLRNASFREANLAGADFSNANLSNACFVNADLRGAVLAGADVEGADFAGADLRRTDLRVASMFGASFCQFDAQGHMSLTARVDATTIIDPATLDALTDDQRGFWKERGW